MTSLDALDALAASFRSGLDRVDDLLSALEAVQRAPLKEPAPPLELVDRSVRTPPPRRALRPFTAVRSLQSCPR